jgi:hypothetical protein
LLSGKKSGLSGRIVRVAEIAETDADQAEALLEAEADSLTQGQGDIG